MHKWINLFPLIIDKRISENSEAESISAWIPSSRILSVDLIRNRKDGHYWIRVELPEEEIRQEFVSYEAATKSWKNLQGALGIRGGKRPGPKRKYFEKLTTGTHDNQIPTPEIDTQSDCSL